MLVHAIEEKSIGGIRNSRDALGNPVRNGKIGRDEEDNLDRVFQEMKQFLPISKKKAKILFVNDGSKDNSQSLIEKICKDNEEFSFISFEKNTGLSAAIKAGFDYVDTP